VASVMPSGAQETFTGANGAAWSATNWVLALNEGSGGGLSIQTNQGRMRTGTANTNRISARLNGVSRADVEVVFTMTLPSAGSQYPKVYLRANTAIDTGTGYYLDLDTPTINIGKSVAYASTNIASHTHGFAAGAVIRVRFALFGSRLRVKVWSAAGAEPSGWQMDTTDTAIASAGSVGWTTAAGTSGSKDFFLDDVNALDTLTVSGPPSLTVTGAVTPAGVVLKTPSKRWTGAVASSGTPVLQRVVYRVFSGAVTSTGALRKGFVRTFSGTIAPTGFWRKVAVKRLGGVLTPSGVSRRVLTRRFTGTIAPVGVLIATDVGRIFGRPGILVMNVVREGTLRIRYRKG
jgi:hypothetical protein